MIYNHITNDIKDLSSEEEEAVLISSWNIGRIFTVIYMVYLLIAGVIFATMPTISPIFANIISKSNESRPMSLCLYTEYFVDEDEYFHYLFVHTFIGIFISTLIVITVDTVFLSSVYHAIGLFNIIDYRMEQIFNYVHDEVQYNSERSRKQLHNNILGSIKIYNNAIQFANLIQYTFTGCLLIIAGIAIMVLSLGSIDIMMNINNPTNCLRIIFVCIGIVMYLFSMSWPGQQIIDSNSKILKSIYFCGWYKLPLKTQYLVRFMMMRCSSPCQLTAGPLLKLNIETFAFILKNALSYFMVMASFSQ